MGIDDEAAGDASVDDVTVLIIDDEPEILASYELYLEDEPYDIVTAENGAEAMVELGPAVDVVLLDRRMPGMSGDEVLDHLTDWHEDCRVVMVTAVDPGPDIVDMPFDDYLTKPIDKTDLVTTIDRLALFDRYEQLLSEYNAETRKYATLKASMSDSAFRDDDRIAALEARRERLREQLRRTVASFDDELGDVVRDAHDFQS
jgi:CheY-like chemotaxis protein